VQDLNPEEMVESACPEAQAIDEEIPQLAPGHEAFVVNMAGEVQDLNPEEMVESACPEAQ
ncbi:unnamed protein product, partial [Prorocentrum cordatum]